MRCLERDGALVLVGLTDQPLTIRNGTQFSYFGQRILGHYGSEPAHVVELVNLIRHGRLDLSRSISGVVSLEDVGEGIRRLHERDGNPIRILVQP